MLYLREYKPRATRLSDHLPWAALVGPGLILNKDGSFQKTVKFRGPDLESASLAQLMLVRSQVNNALRRLGSRWCIHVEAVRHRSQQYPDSAFPDPVSALVDRERRNAFSAEDQHFESAYFLTLTFLPPDETISRAQSLVVENLPSGRGGAHQYRAALEEFTKTLRQLRNILRVVMPEVFELSDEETLTYLHACVSTKVHPVSVPDTPALLDGVLTDDDFIGGLYPRLGKDFLRTVSIRSYPSSSSPGLLDRLNALGASYRWVSRFLPLDKEDARAELNVIRKRWFAKRKGVLGLLKEAVTREPAALEDSDALAKAEDADDALVILGGDAATMGYFTPTVTVTDPDPIELEKKVRDVEAVINRAGFVAKVEDVNAVEAWLGSLPGHAYADRRRPMISTLNLCDALPLNAIWSGPTINAHLTAELSKLGTMDVQPPLAYAKAAGSTPFRLDLHRGDVGHTMVIGPTGSGKSVFLNLIAMQWLRYPRAQIIFFDKGASSRAATLLVGGAYFALGAAASELAFQPLGALDTAKDLTWAQEWLLDLISGEGVETSAEMKREIWMTLQNLAAGPRDQRTLSMFAATIQNRSIKEAVKRFTLEGPYGHLLDADVDFLSQARWLTFEMNELFSARDAVAPTLTHIFHQIEQRFDGRPTLLIIDEAWVFLDNSRFAAKIREWLKTLRKSNVAVIFATQSLSDVARASIAPALIESCPTKIFLPNSDAYTSTISDLYRSFGLTDAQIKIIGQSTPKRDYYFQSSSGNRLFELGLGPATLATVGASSANDQKMIDDLLEAHGEHGFAAAYFRACGLDWASRHIEEARP